MNSIRKLPGRRRGFLFGSSVWMGPDHLLLVKSARFREDYKRFYFRDIQAIVTAGAPRFHLSTEVGALRLLVAGRAAYRQLERAGLRCRQVGDGLRRRAAGRCLGLCVRQTQLPLPHLHRRQFGGTEVALLAPGPCGGFLESVQPCIARAQGCGGRGAGRKRWKKSRLGRYRRAGWGLGPAGSGGAADIAACIPHSAWSTPVSTLSLSAAFAWEGWLTAWLFAPAHKSGGGFYSSLCWCNSRQRWRW